MHRISVRGDLQQTSDPSYERELRSSYRKLADTAPRPLMADALASAFRSSAAGFATLCAVLFEHCNRDQRAQLLTILIRALGTTSRQELVDVIEDRSGVSPDAAAEVSFEDIRAIAAEATRSDSSVVERVSVFFSRVPNITKYLPTPTIAAVLAVILRNSKQAAGEQN